MRLRTISYSLPLASDAIGNARSGAVGDAISDAIRDALLVSDPGGRG